MKIGYVFKNAKAGMTVSVSGSGLDWLRQYMRMPMLVREGPMLDPAGDVVLAAILRWHWLRAMLTGSDLGAAAFAAGVIQARTQLNDHLFWHTAENKWTLEMSYRAWTSCVIKFAGSFAHKMWGAADGQRRGMYLSGCLNNLFYTNGNCVQTRYCSVISDDSGLRANHLKALREQGYLVKPTPKAWAVLSQFMADFSPNGFDILDGGPPPCRAVVANKSGRGTRDLCLAPALTLDLLQHAARVVPGLAKELCETQWFVEDVKADYELWSEERRRYAVWACSVSPELDTQMRMWDLHAANCFDSFMEQGVYAPLGRHRGVLQNGQEFARPPWAQTGPRVSRIVPTDLKGRVLLHGVPA
jgi:hypothetical protein